MNDDLFDAARALAPAQRMQLYQLATKAPNSLTQLLSRGLLVVAALLLGLGLIFWIAANWQLQTRSFKLGLVQAALLACVLAAVFLPKARTAALLAATLVLGGLLALIGQTYQTGADAWQLFAAWAALTLLWTIAQRSDALWTLWVLIAALGLTFWTARGGWRWHTNFADQAIVILAWAALVAVPLVVAQLKWMQALGRWSLRVAAGLALFSWCSQAVMAVFEDFRGESYGIVALCMALIALLGLLAWRSKWRDFACLALAALALNVVILAPFVRAIGFWRIEIGSWGLLSLISLACLGATASWLLRVQRKWHQEAA